MLWLVWMIRLLPVFMSEVYKQKFIKAITMSEDEDDEDN